MVGVMFKGSIPALGADSARSIRATPIGAGGVTGNSLDSCSKVASSSLALRIAQWQSNGLLSC